MRRRPPATSMDRDKYESYLDKHCADELPVCAAPECERRVLMPWMLVCRDHYVQLPLHVREGLRNKRRGRLPRNGAQMTAADRRARAVAEVEMFFKMLRGFRGAVTMERSGEMEDDNA